MTVAESFKLRDYQVEGVEFMRERKRVMLTDAPGLGKTPQATFAAEEPVLVVCPAYLVPQWEAWLISQGKKAASATGMRWERNPVLDDYDSYNWLVVNHEMLDGYEQFADAKWCRRWRTIIIDESHHLKGHNGKRAKAAVKLCTNAEYVFLLTATPVKREIDDLYMQFRIIHPDIFTSYWRFCNQFCVVEKDFFGIQIRGAKQSMRRELQTILDTITLGRNYKTAGRELPPVIEQTILVDLNEETRKMYDELISYWRVRDEAGQLLYTNYMEIMHSLRQHLTGNLKVSTVKGLVEDGKGLAVNFSWYKNTATSIAVGLGMNNCALFHGDIGKSTERIAMAKEALAEGKHVSATIQSLPEGADLSAARNLIFAEEDFTPGSNYQAYSRVIRERIEGDNSEPVLFTYVHCKKTIDESIHKVATRRAGTAKDVIKDALYL